MKNKGFLLALLTVCFFLFGGAAVIWYGQQAKVLSEGGLLSRALEIDGAGGAGALKLGHQSSDASACSGSDVCIYGKTKELWMQTDDGAEQISGMFANPMDSAGDMIIGGVGGAAAKFDSGTQYQVLTNSADNTPSWGLITNNNVDNAAAIAGSKLQAAGGANAGVVDLNAQTLGAGEKTFTSEIQAEAGIDAGAQTIIADTLQADTIKDEAGSSAPNFTYGLDTAGDIYITGTADESKVQSRKTTNGGSIVIVTEKIDIPDVTDTRIFRIQTTDESGNNDGGTYSIFGNCMLGHGVGSAVANGAAKYLMLYSSRAMDSSGVGATSMNYTNTYTTAESTGSRGIGTTTMDFVENSEFSINYRVNTDLTGTVGTAKMVCHLTLIWAGFITPPQIDSY